MAQSLPYPQGIDMYMWGYQFYFGTSLKIFAERLFKDFFAKEEISTFMLGVRWDSDVNYHKICLEPPDIGFVQMDFVDLEKIRLDILAGEAMVVASDSRAQEDLVRSRNTNSARRAIKKILEEKTSNYRFFVSWPVRIDHHDVYIILQLNQKIYENSPSLVKSMPEDGYRVSIPTSLLNCLIDEFLKEASIGLRFEEPGKNHYLSSVREKDLLVRAGTSFMYATAFAGGNIMGIHGWFDLCESISLQKYEKREGFGHLIFGKSENRHIEKIVEFNSSIGVRNARTIRKILELSDEGSGLLTDASAVTAIAKVLKTYSSSEESIFEIRFEGYHRWSMWNGSQNLMVVNNGLPELPMPKLRLEFFEHRMGQILSGITPRQIEKLWALTNEVLKAKHGTMLIISRKAENEVTRFSSQCISIKPIQLAPSAILQLTSIDGSLLFNEDAICFAAGVIIDGEASLDEVRGRGARYNSALRYLKSHGERDTAIIVVSEDGSVDLLPNLPPRLSRNLLEDKLRNFAQMSKSINPDYKDFNELVTWFQEREIYLSLDQCKALNDQRNLIDARLPDRNLRILYQDLAGNPYVDDSYFSE